MNRKNILFALLLIACLPFQSGAQDRSSLKQLFALIEKAFNNYPRLKQGNELIKLNEEQTTLAKGAYMPTIEGDGSYRYAKPTPVLSFPINGQVESFAFFPDNNFDFHVGLTVPIWDFGRTQANVKKTLTQIKTSQDNVAANMQLLAGQVAQLYGGIVFLNRSVEVENDQIKLLEETEKIINDRLKDGDALKLDLLSTRVKISNAQNALIDVQNNLHKQYAMLNMFTGDQGDGYISTTVINVEDFPSPKASPDSNYDVILLNDQLKSSMWDITTAKRGWMPSLFGQAQAGTQNGYVPDVNKMQFAYSAGVGLKIPIFSSARPNYLTKIAQINVQAAKYNIEAQRINVNKDIIQAQSDMEATEGKLKNYDAQLDLAKEALSLANIRYKAGVITNLELLSAQTDLQNAELGRIQLQLTLLLSKLQLIQLGGVKFW